MTLSKMKVDQLRTELKARGLNTSGTKPVLVARLQAARDAEESPLGATGVVDSSPATEAPADPAAKGTTEASAEFVGLSTSVKSGAVETAPVVCVSDELPTKPSQNLEVRAAKNCNESKTEAVATGDGVCSGEVVGAIGDPALLPMEKRIAARVARFGGTEEGRLAERARRFGLNGVNLVKGKSGARVATTAATSDLAVTGTFVVSAEEQARRAKRLKRFAEAS